MPRTSIEIGEFEYCLDARPDRIDHRDRPYHPRLVSLPPSWPTNRDIGLALPYFSRMVDDQGQEGACTGFGLAAVINFVLWRDQVLRLPRNDRGLLAIDLDHVQSLQVSPYQLYHLAQVYDEWGGEDYEGSSCRGAMKGYHKHGVCLKEYWPTKSAPLGEHRTRWQADAASRPLGAYYRIDRLSINDLQAAIYEVGAVYASANVHAGWRLDPQPDCLPVIRRPVGGIHMGAHAFAIIGYETRGFIIQNSWGVRWGYHGFGLLPYEDWVESALDAWVAVMGAPTGVTSSPENEQDEGRENEREESRRDERPQSSECPPVDMTRANTLQSYRVDSLSFAATRKPGWLWHTDSSTSNGSQQEQAIDSTQPLSREEAYALTVVLENDGRPLRRRVGFDTADDVVNEVAYELPLRWFAANAGLWDGTAKLMLYFHGGLNGENDSLSRVERLAPYFLANGIYPLFLTWRTSFLDSIRGILEDSLHRFFRSPLATTSTGWNDAVGEQVSEAKDRAIEVACQHLLVKPIWTQMKQNARASIARGRGLFLISLAIEKLIANVGNCEIHLIGHSAGSLPIGHLLRRFENREIPVASCRLFAPACTVDFANDHFAKAMDQDVLSPDRFYLHYLSDDLERLDRVGPYGKSLLYLVSRALEINHKEPLLGMHWLHESDAKKMPDDVWHVPRNRRDGERKNSDVERWQTNTLPHLPSKNLIKAVDRYVSDGKNQIQQTHGSFDNNVDLMTDAITQIRGSKAMPAVQDLHDR